MDDLLYFLLLIGWLAFSFYQQSAKKKKKQAQMRAAQERDEQVQSEYELEEDLEQAYTPHIEKEEQVSVKTLLEEMLMGEQIPSSATPRSEDLPHHTVENDENKGFIEQEKNIYQKYYDEELVGEEAFADEKTHFEEEPEEDDENEKRTIETVSHFDLRRAVIYSEILNRPYAN
jgi:hypothetical protein